MEYSEGKELERMIDERIIPIEQKINWIIQAMRDSGAIPKAEKEQQEKERKG